MYYKNYGINGELEKMFNSPVNKMSLSKKTNG